MSPGYKSAACKADAQDWRQFGVFVLPVKTKMLSAKTDKSFTFTL